MHLTTTFAALAAALVATMTIQAVANPAPVTNVMSDDEFKNWLAITNAELTFIGKSVDGSVPCAAQDITVTYCTSHTQNVCGGKCTVYNVPRHALVLRVRACFTASASVGFCDRDGCGGSCNQFPSCGTRLNNNFCGTPGTKSIIVPAA